MGADNTSLYATIAHGYLFIIKWGGLMNINRQQWDALGKLNPFWAMTGKSDWDLPAFWQTGYVQVEDLRREISQLGYPQQFHRVLDFGCGIGRLAPAFCAWFDEYVGYDVSEALIQKARDLHQDLDRAQFCVTQRDRIDLPDNSIDLVFSFGVFQHIPDRHALFQIVSEFTRVLKPGGLIFFNVCHHIRWMYRIQLRRRLYWLGKRLGILDYHLFYRFRLYPQSIHALSREALQRHLHTLPVHILFSRSTSPHVAPHHLWEYALTKHG